MKGVMEWRSVFGQNACLIFAGAPRTWTLHIPPYITEDKPLKGSVSWLDLLHIILPALWLSLMCLSHLCEDMRVCYE